MNKKGNKRRVMGWKFNKKRNRGRELKIKTVNKGKNIKMIIGKLKPVNKRYY